MTASYRRATLSPPSGAILKCGKVVCPPSRLWLLCAHFQFASVESAQGALLCARPPWGGQVLRACFKPRGIEHFLKATL